jgi:hypothetical protein
MATTDNAPIPLPTSTTLSPMEVHPGTTGIMPQEEGIPMYLQEKLGSKCCGCFCDYRRAVIWANSFFIGWATFLLLSRDSVVQLSNENFDDDEFANEVSVLVDEYYRKRSIPLGIALATAVLSQVGGAIFFWSSLVALHALALTADFVAFCILALELYQDTQVTLAEINQVPNPPVMSFLLNGALTLLFLYPQIGFLLECRLGIMSAETYPRENFSCCARPKPPFVPTPTTMATTTPGQYPAAPAPAVVSVPSDSSPYETSGTPSSSAAGTIITPLSNFSLPSPAGDKYSRDTSSQRINCC